jgi:ferredoxin-nitrite reductase
MNICPSLFKPTATVDGILTRIRVLFGVISFEQIEAISNLSNIIHITNRANIQIRTSELLPDKVLKNLQELGLAAKNPDLDHLRNVMISPTAGIDSQALLDTRKIAIAITNYLENHSELAILSPKFSIGIDGGESVSIRNQLNDISLQAIQVHNQIYFSLSLVNVPTGVLIEPEHILEVLVALVEVYRNYTFIEKTSDRPPRLRTLIETMGTDDYLKQVEDILGYTLKISGEISEKISDQKIYSSHSPQALPYRHLGLHAQIQPEYSYIGIVVPLGRLSSTQLLGLGSISNTLRLTPWQNVIIPNILNSELESVTAKISELGLSITKNHVYGGLVACSGITGCKSSMTDTQFDARAIASHLQNINLNHPINIHLTGCEKSCAQHHQGDLTLLGIDDDTYQVFVDDDNFENKFGRELYGEYPKSDLPNLISELIQTYQSQRKSDDQSFREFVNCQTIAEIKNLLNNPNNKVGRDK